MRVWLVVRGCVPRVQRLRQQEEVDRKRAELDEAWDSETPIPTQILRDEPSHQWRHVGSIGQEQGEDPHEEPTLMHEEQVANRRGSNGSGTAGEKAVEGSRRQQTTPGRTVPGGDVRYASEESAEEVYRSSTVDVREGGDEQRAHAREDDVHSQFVRRFDDGEVEGF